MGKIHIIILLTLTYFTSLGQVTITVPAEFEKNESLLLAWPYDNNADTVIADISSVASSYGTVNILYNEDADTNSMINFLSNTGNYNSAIRFIKAPHHSFEIRKTGPVTGYGIFNNNMELFFGDPVINGQPVDDSLPYMLSNDLNVNYNAFDLVFNPSEIITDGDLNGFASSEILEQNPELSQDEVLMKLQQYYNIDNFIFLDLPESLKSVKGSIKEFINFLDYETVVITRVPQTSTAYDSVEAIVQKVSSTLTAFSTPFKIIRVDAAPSSDNGNVYKSYTGSLMFNGLLVIPSYGKSQYDSNAYRLYKENTYGCDIEMINMHNYENQGYSVSTITKEIPQRKFLRINHKKIEGENEYEGSDVVIQCLTSSSEPVDKMWLYYKLNSDTSFTKTTVYLVCPQHYGVIPGVSERDTVHYYLEAITQTGYSVTYPVSAPKGYFTFWFNTSSKIKEHNNNKRIKLFPNPAKNFIITKYKGVFMIRDITGNIVKKGISKGNIDLTNITPGVYIFTTQYGESIKFIKE